MVIDTAGLHSTKNIKISDNIKLFKIPPYTPELNPCKKVWQYLKERFKNKTFKKSKALKQWQQVTAKKEINVDNIINIITSDFYVNTFKAHFD